METQDLGRVIYEKEDSGIARLILNWPEKANLQDHDMVWAFDKVLGLAEYDYEVKVLVIKSNAKGFCAGHVATGEYPEFDENRERTGTTWQGHTKLFLHPMLRLWEFPKPTIAQVHGYAAGGGSYWALLPDLTVCSEDAWFQMPHAYLMGRDRHVPGHHPHRLQAADQAGLGADGLPHSPAVVGRHDDHRRGPLGLPGASGRDDEEDRGKSRVGSPGDRVVGARASYHGGARRSPFDRFTEQA
jgi:hypothetical protein